MAGRESWFRGMRSWLLWAIVLLTGRELCLEVLFADNVHIAGLNRGECVKW